MTDANENRGAERGPGRSSKSAAMPNGFYILLAGVLCFSGLRKSVEGYLGHSGTNKESLSLSCAPGTTEKISGCHQEWKDSSTLHHTLPGGWCHFHSHES